MLLLLGFGQVVADKKVDGVKVDENGLPMKPNIFSSSSPVRDSKLRGLHFK